MSNKHTPCISNYSYINNSGTYYISQSKYCNSKCMIVDTYTCHEYDYSLISGSLCDGCLKDSDCNYMTFCGNQHKKTCIGSCILNTTGIFGSIIAIWIILSLLILTNRISKYWKDPDIPIHDTDTDTSISIPTYTIASYITIEHKSPIAHAQVMYINENEVDIDTEMNNENSNPSRMMISGDSGSSRYESI